ncbi:endonuclease/exonuclease/phosphatase family protein [Streptococcus halichoeri]|uniref:endonuclease/exonuclease/phosphatase family protein n=1 Tax=Streptococcus halichoeri TaxID=254785 RepID=UPI0013598789|nr:endonuclease/exonuclease/phosphatase family protein [Streptococcus halichoeri]
MMKWLTINTHSWMEVNALKKLFDLAEHILAQDYDVICLQEINQLTDSSPAINCYDYLAIEGTPIIHRDNYALLLVTYLQKHGRSYYWSWAYNHIGYDIYQEGVAILSKTPFTPESLLISEVDDPLDYHTRRVLIAKTQLDGQAVTFVSLHASWYEKGFAKEWAKLEQRLKQIDGPLVLMGDFNNPTDLAGYRLMMASDLQLQDSHQIAHVSLGDHSILAAIDGWQDSKEPYKVDHILTSADFCIERSAITFDGGQAPIVSDHYGLEVEADWASSS